MSNEIRYSISSDKRNCTFERSSSMLRPSNSVNCSPPSPRSFCSCSLRNDQTSSDRFIRRDLSAFRGATRLSSSIQLSSPLSSITSNNDSLNADKRGKERPTKACYRSLWNCSDCRNGFEKKTRYVCFDSFKLSLYLSLYLVFNAKNNNYPTFSLHDEIGETR